MKRILLFGAGKSATSLIEYLVQQTSEYNWEVFVCDADLELARLKIGNAKNAKAVSIDVKNDAERIELILQADIVISMLPPALHFLIAKDCVAYNKNLLTASYIDDNIRSLKNEIENKGLLFLCEMGLDPGIDHMSAMQLINGIKQKGGKITSFISHCGGLIAPESDNNPWHYKITWNPRNIVLAGKDGAEYRKENSTVKISYKDIFKNCPAINLPDTYPLCWYPNRDSLDYIKLYNLQNATTFIRTTLRHPAFCRGWNKLVNIGLTAIDDYELIKDCKTFADWFTIKTAPFTENKKDWNNDLKLYLADPDEKEFTGQINYLGLQSNQPLPLHFTCSADILQSVLENKLAIQPQDKDMIIMLHELEYTLDDKPQKVTANLMVKGEDDLRTAMSKTVGLPLGIATKLILQDKIQLTGLHIPASVEIYEPVLAELEQNGIKFIEQEYSHNLSGQKPDRLITK